MSDCNFKVAFKGSPEDIYNKTKSAVESQGGQFDGDLSGGKFSVNVLSNTIAGSYQVSGDELQVTITSKPIFLPCNAIESFLKSKLS